ncbi:MAG TPA: hypothetical protein VF771_15730, partial [Longimicrobiaceae bacterium]
AFPCLRCGATEAGAGLVIGGAEGERVARAFLAWAHFRGAPKGQVRAAADAIDAAGSAAAFVRHAAGRQMRLWEIDMRAPAHSLALEIALNDDAERRLLRAEAEAVERQWRREEEIAAIADRELIFLPGDVRGKGE